MDYNLQGLSSRSFEQLVQAIAAKVIGPQLIVFGDGPDGGREATFEGRIPYPSPDAPWTGYGIVQAKFKQRLQNREADGNWALQQLHSELKTFFDTGKSRKPPDYYIFATNVTLTAVETTGFKDKFYRVLREFAWGLRGFDVWDYDKLRVFLDDNEEIRKGYAAWITPGDVLSEVISWIKPKSPDFQQTLTSFLQKELLSDQYVNLEQAGHSKEQRTPIARVFVDLPTLDRNAPEPPVEQPGRPQVPGIVDEIIESAAERLDPQALGILSAEGRAGFKASNKKGRYVVTGGPGQGKTTVCQFICQLFRTSILRDLPAEQIDPEAQQVLDSIIAQVPAEGLSVPGARRFPLRIVLSQFAKSLAAPGPPNSLLSYIVEIINKRTDQAVSVADLKIWLGTYPWLMVFDGLDEVPASSNREAVLEAIRDFRIDARNCNADILIIGTTRPQGYNDDFNPDLYHHVWLAPLSTNRAMHYARRLVTVRYSSDQDRIDKILNRLDRASKNEATIRLMRSPLQVTIMATLVDRMGQPPQERWNLFKEYYRVIYQREVERDIPAAAILRDYQPDVDTIHNYVGLLLQVESERSGQTDARLSREQFEQVVENRLLEEGHAGETFKNLKKQIIEAAVDRLVFLVGLQTDKVGFEIRSLQEFMAAEGLMNGSDELVRKRLREIAPVSNWRNVFLFAAGKCFTERQHLRDTIQTICAELNEDVSDGPVRETLVGSRLAIDLLEDGPARRQPKYAQSLARLALRLLDQPPDKDQARIASLYEPALDRVYQEEIQLRISQVDQNRRLGAWTTLLPLVEIPLDWALSLAEKRWPVDTMAQFAIITNGVFHQGKWLLSKMIGVIPRISPVLMDDHFRDRSISYGDVQIPDWLSAVDDLIFSENFYIKRSEATLNDPSVGPNFEIRFLRSSGQEWMWPLQDMPDPSAGWLSLIGVVKFVQNPSVDELLVALKTILDNPDIELRSWLVDRLPWPLSSALAFTSKFGFEEVQRLAAEGKFGDRSGWAQAELRWLNNGFSSQDILYAGRHLPFDDKIASLGFPFSSPMSLVIDDDRRSVVPILLTTYRQLEEPFFKAWVAGWILFILSTLEESEIEKHWVPSIEEFQTLIRETTSIKESVYLKGLEFLDFEDQLDERAMEFFDWLGKQKIEIRLEKKQINPLPELLAAGFLLNPSRVGILRSLSYWIAEKPINRLPKEFLDPKKYDDILIKEAALTVKLVQGEWGPDETQELADYAAGFLSSALVSEVLLDSNSLQRNVSPSLYGSLLLELRKRLSSQMWREDAEILQRLSDLIRRRTSRLAEPQVWEDLGLPAGLRPVLYLPQG